MSASDRYPLAFQFLGAYLHQDWDVEYPSADAAVEHAIADWAESARLPEVQRELSALLVLEDAELQTTMNALCSYHPPGTGLTYREWLTAVVGRVAANT